MKIQMILIMLLLGVVLTVHLAMNGQVGAALKNPRVGNALFWCIGAITALVIGFSGWRPGALEPLKQINPLLLTAGVMGGCLVFGIAWVFPRFGAANGTICLLAGQMVSGLIISHFGWLGSPQQPVTLLKLAAVVLLFVGVGMMVYEPKSNAAPPASQNVPAMSSDEPKKP
jgi:transporter family-2 protein